MQPEQRDALREPFPASQVGKLPKAGMHLDYVGHAAVTDRLLAVDPDWSWEPMARDEHGLPALRQVGKELVLWINLTVCGVTRPGCGSCLPNAGDVEKQLISDALRNAAMRFGVALDLWSKEDLHSAEDNVRAAAQYDAEHKALIDAKAAVAKACGGDKALARKVWGDRKTAPTADELEAMLTEAEQLT